MYLNVAINHKQRPLAAIRMCVCVCVEIHYAFVEKKTESNLFDLVGNI